MLALLVAASAFSVRSPGLRAERSRVSKLACEAQDPLAQSIISRDDGLASKFCIASDHVTS